MFERKGIKLRSDPTVLGRICPSLPSQSEFDQTNALIMYVYIYMVKQTTTYGPAVSLTDVPLACSASA